MTAKKPIPFSQLISLLLNEEEVFPPRFLHRLSDLTRADAHLLANAWPKIAPLRRKTLMEDLEELTQADDLLSFEDICRLAINDQDASVRLTGVRILREYDLTDLIPDFLYLLQKDPSAEVRAAAAAALGIFVYMGEVDELHANTFKELEGHLLRITQGVDEILVRRRALEALGYSSRKDIPPLIEQAYDSNNTDWILSALIAMGRSADRAWKPKVVAILDHANPLVRAEAASAAGELELKSVRPTLLRMLHDPDQDVRMASSWALSQLGGEGVRSTLEKLIESTTDDEESDLIEKALDNLDFTEEMAGFALLDIGNTDDEEDDLFSDYQLDDEDEEETLF